MHNEPNNSSRNSRRSIYSNKNLHTKRKVTRNSAVVAILGVIITALSGILIIYYVGIIEKANQDCRAWSCGVAGESVTVAFIILIFIMGIYELIRKHGGYGLVLSSVLAMLYSSEFFLEVMLEQSRDHFIGTVGTTMFIALVFNTAVLISALIYDKISKR
ncbi:hypothetical protein IKF86_01580 [Candidatus Saccharibacteria bacterium]|nr:hypothetical protein [Candidatus Saccharibacteria bacterium]